MAGERLFDDDDLSFGSLLINLDGWLVEGGLSLRASAFGSPAHTRVEQQTLLL